MITEELKDIFKEKEFDFELVTTKLKEIKTSLEKYKTKFSERKYESFKKLYNILIKFYDNLLNSEIPNFSLNNRSMSNIVLDEIENVWVYADKLTTKSAKTSKGSRQIVLLVYTINFLINQLKTNKTSTMRELYYCGKGWPLSFTSQAESNLLIECLEIALEKDRGDFSLYPENDGHLIGSLVLEEENRRGEIKRLDCSEDVNEVGFPIPADVDKIKLISTTADFVMVIETGGMYRRLVENEFDKIFNCVLINADGQPSRATKRMIKRLSQELKLSAVAFLDADQWSNRIYASIAWGSVKTAHLSTYFATPNCKWLGVQPSDILRFNLPCDKLKEVDRNAGYSLLKDPRFEEFPDFIKEIKLQLILNKKAEQQSFSKYGIDFVTNTYLPFKLKEMGLITEQKFKKTFVEPKNPIIDINLENEIKDFIMPHD